jgi:hypothetical protein
MRRHAVRVLAGLLLFAALLAPGATPDVAAKTWPEKIPLPTNWQPEGIVTGRGPIIYSGSRPTGAIYAANLLTGEGTILVPGQTGRAAIGLDFDARTNYIYVAGGATGNAYIYNAATGAAVQTYPLTAPGTFLNDAIVTRDAAYFTDSRQAVLFRIPLGPGGEPALPADVETIQLVGEYQHVAGMTNANGIEATPNGEWLIVVNTVTAELYRVAPDTGVATLIDLGGASVVNGDGLLLRGHTLYVVRNRSNQIAVFKLAPDLSSATLVDTITSPNFDVPTTIAAHGSALYVVNARFGAVPAPTTFDIVRVPTK